MADDLIGARHLSRFGQAINHQLTIISSPMKLHRTKFETEMQVRPDDIDMFQHVHSSRYLDYLLAARFEQMERCYKMPMQEFLKLGLGWVVKTSHFEYKRPLCLAEWFTVRTWIEDMRPNEVEV